MPGKTNVLRQKRYNRCMDKMSIRKLHKNEGFPWELLLLADPEKINIEKYIYSSATYIALLQNEVIGEYVLTNIHPGIYELKNIAVSPKYQGKGIGKQLVLDAIEKVKSKGAKRIEAGTGNSSFSQLALYQKCGFSIMGIERGFFTKNYKETIVENGIICKDMIRLAINLI